MRAFVPKPTATSWSILRVQNGHQKQDPAEVGPGFNCLFLIEFNGFYEERRIENKHKGPSLKPRNLKMNVAKVFFFVVFPSFLDLKSSSWKAALLLTFFEFLFQDKQMRCWWANLGYLYFFLFLAAGILWAILRDAAAAMWEDDLKPALVSCTRPDDHWRWWEQGKGPLLSFKLRSAQRNNLLLKTHIVIWTEMPFKQNKRFLKMEENIKILFDWIEVYETLFIEIPSSFFF